MLGLVVLVVAAARARELDSFEQIWVKTCFRLLTRPTMVALLRRFLLEGIAVEKFKDTLNYLRGKS